MDVVETICCKLCSKFYNNLVRSPRVLVCGHTFCLDCLEKLFHQKDPFCPECQVSVEFDRVDSIPINLVVVSLLKNYQSISSTVKDEDNLDEPKGEDKGLCAEHSAPVRFMCTNHELLVCDSCSSNQHANCNILLISSGLGIIRKAKLKKVTNLIETLNSNITLIDKQIHFAEDKVFDKKVDLSKAKMKINNLQTLKFQTEQAKDNLNDLKVELSVSTRFRKFNESDVRVGNLLLNTYIPFIRYERQVSSNYNIRMGVKLVNISVLRHFIAIDLMFIM